MKKATILFLSSFIFLSVISGVYQIFQDNNLVNQNQQASLADTLSGRPANRPPVGYLNTVAITSGGNTGWTVDPNVPTQSIQVALFIDTAKTVAGTSFLNTTANISRPDVTKVFSAYSGNHGFTYTIPVQYQDGKNHMLYAYAIDAQTGAYQPLLNSPRAFNLASTKAVSGNFTIVASASSGGSIIPSGNQTVPATYVANYTITPSVGYQISKVTVDGIPWTGYKPINQNTYTFSNVKANHKIDVIFSSYAPVANVVSNKFAIGDFVQVTVGVCALSGTVPSSTCLGIESAGTTGTVLYGPVVLGNTVLWGVRYDVANGLTGWSDEKSLAKINDISTQNPISQSPVDTTPAPAPQNPVSNQQFVPANVISTSNVTSSNVSLSWPQITGASGYGIYVNNVLLDTTTATSYDTNDVLMPDTSYTINISPFSDASQVSQTLTLTQPKATGFWANIWSSMVAAAGNVLGISSQSGDVTKTIQTPPASQIPTLAPVDQPLKVLAILLNYYGNTNQSSSDTASSVNAKLFGDGQSVKNYWAETSYGKFNIDGDVVDTVNVPLDVKTKFDTISGSKISTNTDLMYLAANEYAASVLPQGKKLSDYKIIIYVWSKLDGGTNDLRGIADSIGPIGGEIKGRIWINGIQEARTFAHEIGHKLGLYHADGIICQSVPSESFLITSGNFDPFQNCKMSPYHDPIDVMGNIRFAQIDPYRKNTLGWIPKNNITSSGRYAIAPTESTSAQAFVIAQPSMEYKESKSFYLDYRRQTGLFDTFFLDGLSIEVVPASTVFSIFPTPDDTYYLQTGSSATTSVPYTINDGESFYTPFSLQSKVSSSGTIDGFQTSGVKIIQISHNNNVANIFVRFDTVPVVSAVSATVNNQPSGAYTGKVKLSWTWPSGNLAPTGGYQVYRDATTTSSLIYTGSNTFYTDTVSAGSGHLYYVRGYDAFPELANKPYPMPFSPATFGGNSFGVMSQTASHSATQSLNMDPINPVCMPNSNDLTANRAFYDIANTPQYYKTNKLCSTFNGLSWLESDNILTGTIKILPNGPTIYYDQPKKGTGYSEYFFKPDGSSALAPTPGGRTYYYFPNGGTALQVVK